MHKISDELKWKWQNSEIVIRNITKVFHGNFNHGYWV